MGEAVLELTNVTKMFGSRAAVNNISLTVNEGEVFGFIGPNGAGKTTTIRMIVGLASITNGEIRVCGNSIKKDYENALRNIGAIIENPELYGYLTGRQNLELFAGLYKGIPKSRVDEVVKLVKLENRINDKLKRYSLGMRQRLGIAQSLLHKPKILVLDEPTNGLDPSGIHEMRDLFKELAHKEKMTVFVSSHILSEMQIMCDRAAIIDRGILLKTLSMDELGSKLSESYVFKTGDGTKAVEVLNEAIKDTEILQNGNYINIKIDESLVPVCIKALTKAKIDIFSIKPVSTSLEEMFLSVTKDTQIN